MTLILGLIAWCYQIMKARQDTIRVIQVEAKIRSITRPIVFMVIALKASYNLLVGWEGIHGVGAEPSSLHQRVVIWREDEIRENIKEDQGYLMVEINHMDWRNFDRSLENIAPCLPAEFA